MKYIVRALSLFAVLLFTAPAMAQNAHEASVKFMKEPQNAIIMEYNLPSDVVEAALKERLDKSGFGKSHSEKGFTSYKAVNWNEVSPDKLDIYTRVDGDSKKATVIFLVSKGYDNFISSRTDSDKVQKVILFLNSLVRDIAAYQLRLAISQQEEAVKRAEREYKKVDADGDRLVRDRERVEKDMAANKSEKEKRQSELEGERKKLEDMKKQIAQ